MSANHTPGPWWLQPTAGGHALLVRCDGTRTIASVDNSDDEDRANAGLIAAAPDLLEIVEQWQAWRELGNGAAEQPADYDCRAAIAKAKGAP